MATIKEFVADVLMDKLDEYEGNSSDITIKHDYSYEN